MDDHITSLSPPHPHTVHNTALHRPEKHSSKKTEYTTVCSAMMTSAANDAFIHTNTHSQAIMEAGKKQFKVEGKMCGSADMIQYYMK